jgi:hypothetical protein
VTRLVVGTAAKAARGLGEVATSAVDELSTPASDEAEAEGGRSAVDLAAGTAFELQDRVASVAEAAARTTRAAASVGGWLFDVPALRPAKERVSEELDRLEERGRTELDEGASEGGALLGASIDRLVSDPDLMAALVNQVIGPLLDALLPAVIDSLSHDPTKIQELVKGQSTSIAGQLADSMRSRTLSADDLAEDVVRKLTFRSRKRGELSAADQLELPPGGREEAG